MNCVVKFRKDEGSLWFQNEKETLNALQSRPDSVKMVRICQDIPQVVNCLYLRPLCQSSLVPWETGKKGYVHCDLRPENILIGSDGKLVLCDFAAARKSDSFLWYEHGTILLKLQYIIFFNSLSSLHPFFLSFFQFLRLPPAATEKSRLTSYPKNHRQRTHNCRHQRHAQNPSSSSGL
jgi:serine/threonine protein kinase